MVITGFAVINLPGSTGATVRTCLGELSAVGRRSKFCRQHGAGRPVLLTNYGLKNRRETLSSTAWLTNVVPFIALALQTACSVGIVTGYGLEYRGSEFESR
jgi:hypothetical protein